MSTIFKTWTKQWTLCICIFAYSGDKSHIVNITVMLVLLHIQLNCNLSFSFNLKSYQVAVSRHLLSSSRFLVWPR